MPLPLFIYLLFNLFSFKIPLQLYTCFSYPIIIISQVLFSVESHHLVCHFLLFCDTFSKQLSYSSTAKCSLSLVTLPPLIPNFLSEMNIFPYYSSLLPVTSFDMLSQYSFSTISLYCANFPTILNSFSASISPFYLSVSLIFWVYYDITLLCIIVSTCFFLINDTSICSSAFPHTPANSTQYWRGNSEVPRQKRKTRSRASKATRKFSCSKRYICKIVAGLLYRTLHSLKNWV